MCMAPQPWRKKRGDNKEKKIRGDNRGELGKVRGDHGETTRSMGSGHRREGRVHYRSTLVDGAHFQTLTRRSHLTLCTFATMTPEGIHAWM